MTEVVENTEGTEPEVVEPGYKAPKGISEDMVQQARSIIVSGFQANQDPDVIKSEIFKLGIPFSKLNALFNGIARAENLVADPKEVKFNVTNALSNVELTYEETWEELAATAANIAGEVNGATVSKVMGILKAEFKDNEAEFPKKPKGAGSQGPRMGQITRVLINLFLSDHESGAQEVYEAILPHVKGQDNAIYYTKQYHKLCYAIANQLSAEEVLAKFAGDNG